MKAHTDFQEKQYNFIWSRAAVQVREEDTVKTDCGTLVRTLKGSGCSMVSPFMVSKVRTEYKMA